MDTDSGDWTTTEEIGCQNVGEQEMISQIRELRREVGELTDLLLELIENQCDEEDLLTEK